MKIEFLTEDEVLKNTHRSERAVIGEGMFPTLKYYQNASYLFGCATGFGKSWFTAIEAVKFASQGKKVVIIETELEKNEMIYRLTKCGKLTDIMYNIAVISMHEMNIAEITSEPESFKDVDVLIIDHIGAASIKPLSTDICQSLLKFSKLLDNFRSDLQNKGYKLTLICYTQTTGGSKIDRNSGKQTYNPLTYQYCTGLDQSFDYGCYIERTVGGAPNTKLKLIKMYVNKDRYGANNNVESTFYYDTVANTVMEK